MEYCNICGREMEPSEASELMDGYLCEDCLQQISPWFCDLDLAEVGEIQQQLELRRQNQQALRNFHPTRQFGTWMKVLVDDKAGNFLLTDQQDFLAENPDLIQLSQVIYCELIIEEERTKLGSRLYEYRYLFQLEITLEHPYLDEMRFALNEEPLVLESSHRSFLGVGGFDPSGDAEYAHYVKLGEKICDVLNCLEDAADDNTEYLINDPAPEAEQVVQCPWCGARVKVTDSYTCGHCGGPL